MKDVTIEMAEALHSERDELIVPDRLHGVAAKIEQEIICRLQEEIWIQVKSIYLSVREEFRH